MADEASVPAVDTPAVATTEVATSPSVIDLKEDTLVRLPGNKEPVAYGKWFGDYQRKHTEATTARSTLQKELKAAQERHEALQTEAARYRAALDIRQPSEDPRRKLAEQFEQLPYVKGSEAAQLYQDLVRQVDEGSNALKIRDQAIRLMAQEVMNLKQGLGQVLQHKNVGDFNSKISRYRDELGLPEEAQEYLAELYSAYEGEDLDSEFPNIAKKRVEQLKSMFTALQKKQVEEARRNRFVPGKGGQGTPGKPGLPDTSKMSAKETADVLFDAMQRGEDT